MDMQPGALNWFELQTPNQEAAQTFYAEIFGWEFELDHSTGIPYTMIKVGGKPVGGIWESPPEMQIPPSWQNYITVTDVDALAEKVPTLGGKILKPPADIPNVGRFCILQDPQGAVISAITYIQPA